MSTSTRKPASPPLCTAPSEKQTTPRASPTIPTDDLELHRKRLASHACHFTKYCRPKIGVVIEDQSDTIPPLVNIGIGIIDNQPTISYWYWNWAPGTSVQVREISNTFTLIQHERHQRASEADSLSNSNQRWRQHSRRTTIERRHQ